VAQRFTYADNAPSNAVRNLCGRLIRHDDEAGSVLKEDYGLRAETLSERRHFLADMDAPDWPSSFTGRDLLLEPDSGATTGWQYSPTGELMHRIDAANHRQTMSYTLAGHLERVTLHTRDGIEREVFHSAAYNAFGQLERQMAGNGVISRDVHDSADGRLLTRRAARADGSVVQDLSYGYDPVGNIVWIEDHTQPTRHFDNQRIDGISTFTHDTLYQLIEASGREAAGARSQPGSPHVGGDPGDTSQ
jgi:insecticidal toxin complex protein TccC